MLWKGKKKQEGRKQRRRRKLLHAKNVVDKIHKICSICVKIEKLINDAKVTQYSIQFLKLGSYW